MAQIVSVSFNDGYSRPKEYYFRCYENVEVGDKVVVSTKNVLSVATIVDILEKMPTGMNIKAVYAEVVCKVDMSAFNERKELAERAMSLKTQMDERVQVIQENEIYKLLSEKDPTLKKLFEEYSAIELDA